MISVRDCAETALHQIIVKSTEATDRPVCFKAFVFFADNPIICLSNSVSSYFDAEARHRASRANHSRTHTSSDTTGLFVLNGWADTTSTISRRVKITLRAGYGHITTNDQRWGSVASHQYRNWKQLKFYSRTPLQMGRPPNQTADCRV